MLELKNIRKSYGDVIPLKNASTVIHKGDVISVIGPSGTGKSTLLRCINMLEQPDSGDILLNGETVNQSGYLFCHHRNVDCPGKTHRNQV